MKTWQFEPLDSSFFRGARSFNLNESGFLESQFPPTAQTLAGVIRAAIGESKGVDWQKFRDGEQEDVAALIGKRAEDAGKLSFVGPYLIKGGKRLYPVPLHLLYSSKAKAWGKLAPSKETYRTDKGEWQLPEVVKQVEGGKPLENVWLDEVNFNQVLTGGVPTDHCKKDDLFKYENRTGIGRDNAKRTTKEGALFFTRHIRLEDNVKLAMSVIGADDVTPASMVRLGGEGRMASLKVNDGVDFCLRGNDGETERFTLILLTHGDFKGKSEPELPDGFTLISACVGKAVREGGWDYAQRKPKPLKSLVPAGSVYFVEGDASKLGTHIGERSKFGYGEIAIGTWEKQT